MGRNKKKSNNNVNVTKTSANTTAPAADASISTTNDNNTTNTTSSTSSNQPSTSSSSLIDALQNTNTDTENLKLRIKKAKQQLSKVVDILKMDNRSEWTESSMTDTNIIAGSCSSTTDDHNKIITEDEKLKNIKTTGKDAVKLENIQVIESSVSVVEQQQQQQQPKAKKRNRNKNKNKTQTEELNNDNVNNESVEKSVNDQLLPIQKNQVDKIEQQNNETPPAPQKQPKRKNKKSKNMVTETVVVDDTSVLNSSAADETDDCLRKNNDDDTLAVVNLPSTLQQESTESKREDDDDKVIIDKNTIVKESTIAIQSKESVPIANDEKTQKIEGKTTEKDVVIALNEMDKVNDASCDMTNKTKKPNKKQKKQMEKEQTKQIIEEKISLTSCNKPEEQLTNQTETVSELNQNLPLSPLEISTGNPDVKSKNNIIMTNENEQKEIVEKIIFEKFNILSNKINPNSGVDPATPPPSPSSTPKNHNNNNNNSDATNQSLKTGQNTCNVKGSGKKHKGAKLTEKNIEQSTATAATITKDSNFTEETVELRETELSKPNEKIQMTDETIIVVKEPIDKHPPSGCQNNSNLNKIEPSEIKQQPIIEELVKKEEKFEENNLNKNPPSPAKKDKNKKKDVKKSLNDNKTSKEDQKTSKEEQKASDLKPIGQNENIDLSVDKQSTDKTTPKDTNNNNKEKSIEMPSSVLNENIPINPIDLIDRTSETTTATSNKTIVDSIIENVLQQIECTKLIDDESQINQVENIEQPKSPKSSIHDNNNALESFVSIISSDDIIINEQLSLPVVELKDENKAQSSDTVHSIVDVKDDIIITEIPCDDAEIFEIITQTSKTNHDIDKKKPPTKLTELITKNIPNTVATSSKSTKKSSKSPDPSHHTNKKLKNDNRSVVEPNKKSSNKEVICPAPQNQQHVNKSKQIKMKTNHDQSAINTDQPEISSSSLAAATAAAVMTTSTDGLLIIEKETIINTEEESNETEKIIDPTKQQLEQQQQSLLSTISKNAEGSDFVQSVKLPSPSLTEAIAETKTTNQFETKSLVKQLQSPKLVKDLQNLQQSINEKTAALAATGSVAATEATTSINEDNEMKHHELPEKTAQQKLDSIQFSDIKLINNLEAKMTISNNATATNNQLTKNKNDQLENVIASSSSSTAPPIPPTRPTRLSKKPQIPPKPEHLLKNLSKKITPLLMEQLNNYDNNNNDITTTNLKSSISSSNDDNNSKQSTSASSILVQSLLSSPPQPDDEFIKMPLHDVAAAEKVNVNDDDDIDEDDDDFEDVAEEYIEYKFTPRQMFMSTICHICKISLTSEQYTLHQCGQCKMIGYCSQEHCANDLMTHKPLCGIIQEIARKRGGHIYNNARILNNDDYRSLRVHTLSICENLLARPLQPFEREILLFPRLCIKTTCREWRQHLLVDCSACGQVSYCRDHPEHLQMEIHETWCKSFALYQALVKEQIEKGRIEPELPTKIVQLNQYNILHKNFDSIFKDLYKNYSATIRDNCTWATLTQLATAPLTAFYGSQIARQVITERMVIHLIGAELQFEADTLDKWETFFLHLIPQLMELQIVFIGPELNVEHLPLEILSRIRMCRHCRQSCRCVKFDFQWGKLYHDYCKTSAFIKPDLICYFNPGLYRKTGYNGLDTWPETIKSSLNYDCPIIVTSYTEMEAPCDLQRIQQESIEDIKIIKLPHKNPFSAQRPERNFISDEIAPMIFKNYYYFIIK